MDLRSIREERARRILVAEKQRRQVEADKYNWERHARPNQLPPDWEWRVWLVLAGRGFGKTRCGGEWVRRQIKNCEYVNLIGATTNDARDVMIEGESGILAICPRDERPEYQPSKGRLAWPNGAKSLIFTGEEPERLRGKQSHALWADELASWKYAETWDQAMFGLRLGKNPQAVVTTTPRPTKIVKELAKDPTTAVTRGTSYENRDNLAPAFFEQIIKKYEGTRMGRQELQAEILTDNPSALWQRARIDELRVRSAPPLLRIVVAIDPAVTSNPDSDLTGIVVVGIASDGHCYVLGDYSLQASTDAWAKEAVRAYRQHQADRIVAETNNGGDLVEHVLRTVDRQVPYRKVHASRGKVIRAEPVAALYEQGRVHHVGTFALLEDEMCEFDATVHTKSPDRMDALVWAVSDLTQGTTRKANVAELRL